MYQQFVALKTFFSPGKKSEYVEGLTYTMRPRESYRGKVSEKQFALLPDLETLVPQWAAEGKVMSVGPMADARISGIGEVS